MGREEEIRLIAYDIWEQEGCTSGYDCDHWYRAEFIWEQQQKPDVTGRSAARRPRKVAEQKAKTTATKRLKKT